MAEINIQGTPDQLSKDLQTVEDRSKNIKGVERSIANLEATPTEVLDWYFAQDPMSERKLINVNGLMRSGKLSDALTLYNQLYTNVENTSILSESAATTLLASVYFPEAFTQDERGWLGRINQDDVFTTCMLREGIHKYSAEDLEKLLIAAQLFQIAATSSLTQNNYPSEYFDLYNFSPRAKDLQENGNKLYEIVCDRGLKDDTPVDQKMVGITALWLSFAPYTNALRNVSYIIPSQELLAAKETFFLHMLDTLEDVFLGEHGVPNGELKKYRGKLYELIWYLDAIIYQECHPQPFIMVTPSFTNEDMPRINHPKFNRGYDIKIWDMSDSSKPKVQYIQLKSKSNLYRGKDYHPDIQTVADDNFNEAHPQTLKHKINTYRKFVDSHFSSELVSEAESRILPSVKQVLSNSEGRKEMLPAMADANPASVFPLNRRARRLMESSRKMKRIIDKGFRR